MIVRRKTVMRLILPVLVTLGIMAAVSGDPLAGKNLPDAEFKFLRLIYSSGPAMGGYGYWGRGRWTVDWPDAENHFLQGLRRMTRVNASESGHVLSLMDDALFDYPWLYVVEVGHWHLSDIEAERLREYLLRGGFLMIDDFHGSQEWAGFMASMRKVFPTRQVVSIPEDDEVMRVFYELDNRIQIHGIQAIYSGRTFEKDGFIPHWRGFYDDNGRLMVAINFNMDIGDAWEHADDPRYPEPMTALAYRFGINYVIYAMTR
jgi:hypothetical protein